MADDSWVADGSATNVWKRFAGVVGGVNQALFGVDLKLGSSTPPAIRQVEVGPDNTAATNVARNRAIRLRDRISNTVVSPANPAGLGLTHTRDPLGE